MSAHPNNHQAGYFYDDAWSEKMDRRLVMELDKEFNYNNWYVGDDISRHEVVTRLRRLLNVVYDRDFTEDFYDRKVTKLQRRFESFHWLLKQKGVIWDSFTNGITADPKTWSKAVSDKPLALAYQFEGEPHFNILSNLFESTYTTSEELDSEAFFIKYEGMWKEESSEYITD